MNGLLYYIVINKVLLIWNKNLFFWIINKHNNRVIATVWTLEKLPSKEMNIVNVTVFLQRSVNYLET